MSISSELLTLNNTKTAIRTAINQKGGSVGASDTFASYATAIDNLPSGGDNSTLIDLIERDITSINIPSGTTKIGAHAFYSASTLTSVTTPNTVTTIGESAFGYCFNLVSFNIPNSVTSIGDNTFFFCRSLTSLTISDSVTSIGRSAFSNCSGLLTLKIGSGINRINESTFANCTSLTSIMLNGTTPPPMIGGSGFANTNNCPIYVPAASVDTYKAASGWSSYASRIYPITHVATVDGNPVYNYEIGNKDATAILSTEMAKLPTGTSIEFAEGITNMSGSISGYTTVILPSTFTTFNDQDMIGSSVTTLTMKSTTPTTAERNKFGGSGLTAIYVPASAVDTYKADSGWSSFASIIQAIPTE